MIRRLTPYFLYLSSLLLIVFAIFGSRGVLNLRSLKREANNLHNKGASLEAEVDKVRTELHGIEHDSSALERRARAELGLSRSDEILYVEKRISK